MEEAREVYKKLREIDKGKAKELLDAVNRKDIKSGKLCAYGLTRGGYFGIRLLVTY